MSKTVGVILSLADKCSPVLKGIAKQFGSTEKQAKQTAQTLSYASKTFVKTTAGVMGAVGLVVGGITVATKKVMEYGDNIDKTSKKIGMSAKAYQQWDFIMSQNGGTVDNLSGAYKGLRTQLVQLQKGSKDAVLYFTKLGVSVKNSNGQYRSQEEIFEDCVKALQSMTDETERALIGQKIFGKGFQELAPLLSSGAGSIDKLKKEFADLNLGMSDEDIKKAVELKDSWDKVGRSFNMVGMQIGITLMPYVQELTNSIIKNLPAIKGSLLPVLEGVGNTLGFLIVNLRGVISVLNGVIVGLTTAKVCAMLFGMSMKVAMASTGVGLLVVALSELILHWKDLCNWVVKTGRAIKSVFTHKKPSKEDTGVNDNTKNTPNRNALGTSYYSGGLTSVNENGPEIIDLPSGSRIYPNSLSEKMAQSSNNFNITLNIQGNVIGNREYMEEVGRYLVGEIRKVVPA